MSYLTVPENHVREVVVVYVNALLRGLDALAKRANFVPG